MYNVAVAQAMRIMARRAGHDEKTYLGCYNRQSASLLLPNFSHWLYLLQREAYDS